GARSCLPTASSNQHKHTVYLVDLVHLVSFFQPKNQTNQITHRLSHRSSVSRWPATDWGSTTIEEFLALASQWQTARSGRHRLSSGGRTRRPARIGGHLQPYLNVVHDRHRARTTPVEDHEGSTRADWETHPA